MKTIFNWEELPVEIQRRYVYTPDGGHNVYCVLSKHLKTKNVDKHNYENFLVPVPLKRVLRDYTEIFHFLPEDGGRCYVIVVDMEYDSELGLIFNEDDVEY